MASWSGREKAVQEALVTAQELRSEMKTHAQRQADLVLAEAQAEARRRLAETEAEIRVRCRDADRRLEKAREALEEMERRRLRFLKSFRQLLERETDVVEVEEGLPPLEERPIELELGGGRSPDAGAEGSDEPDVRPDLDTPVEDLAGLYRAEGGALFDDAPSAQSGERDLFSPDDTREGDANARRS